MISLINSRGATVGDNLLDQLLKNHLNNKGHQIYEGYHPNSSIVVFGAGGLIWENTYPPILKDINRAVHDKKRCVGTGLGVQGLFSKEKWGFLRRFKSITVRNMYSYESIKTVLGIETIPLSDLAWVYEPKTTNPQENTIGIIHPQILRYPLQIRALKNLELEKRFISFQIPATSQYEEAIKTVGGTIVTTPFSPLSDIVLEMSKCKYIIAGHLHAVILSILVKRPCIILPLRDKIRALVKENNLLHFSALTDDEILIKLKSLQEYSMPFNDLIRCNREKASRSLQILLDSIQS